jgi:hypothetical protein
MAMIVIGPMIKQEVGKIQTAPIRADEKPRDTHARP